MEKDIKVLKLKMHIRAESGCWIQKIDAILIQEDVSYGKLHKILVEMKNSNVDKDSAYKLLEEMRTREYTDGQDDLLLELMDIVSGFCSPHARLWN